MKCPLFPHNKHDGLLLWAALVMYFPVEFLTYVNLNHYKHFYTFKVDVVILIDSWCCHHLFLACKFFIAPKYPIFKIPH